MAARQDTRFTEQGRRNSRHCESRRFQFVSSPFCSAQTNVSFLLTDFISSAQRLPDMVTTTTWTEVNYPKDLSTNVQAYLLGKSVTAKDTRVDAIQPEAITTIRRWADVSKYL